MYALLVGCALLVYVGMPCWFLYTVYKVQNLWLYISDLQQCKVISLPSPMSVDQK